MNGIEENLDTYAPVCASVYQRQLLRVLLAVELIPAVLELVAKALVTSSQHSTMPSQQKPSCNSLATCSSLHMNLLVAASFIYPLIMLQGVWHNSHSSKSLVYKLYTQLYTLVGELQWPLVVFKLVL